MDAQPSTSRDDLDEVSVIRAVICQELGIEPDEIEADSDLRQHGLNSLTALMITVNLLADFKIDIGPGILKENYSLRRLREALHRKGGLFTSAKAQPKIDATFLECPVPAETSNINRIEAIPPAARSTADVRITKVMEIIGAEMNIEQAELVDSVEWASLGLDSIMSLAICGRLREDLEMEVESTIFAEYDSVGAFKKYLSQD